MRRAVSLFTGCGGSDAGLVEAGFEVLLANDVLPYAKEVYEENLPKTDYRVCDVRQIKSFPQADLLVGCYPCQGFSQGGARDPGRNINFLYREFDRALRSIRPKAFVVENVSGMTRDDFFHLLQNQIVRFRLAGYRVAWSVLDARDFGVPQERKRIFLVGLRSSLGLTYSFPSPTHGPKRSQPFTTIGDAIGDMPAWPQGEFCEDEFHWYYMSRNRYRAWNEQSKTIVSKMRHMPLHPSSPRLIRIHTDKWRFENKKPARRLSYKEAARLQGFQEDFQFPDRPTIGLGMRYRVIGNSVPPPLFKAVVQALPHIW